MRNSRVQIADQLDAGRTRMADQPVADIAHQKARIEGKTLEDELTCIDLRQIQDVADERAQHLRRAADRLHIVALLRVQRGPSQELGHTDDAGQRGTQLMRHEGEKIASRLIGPFGLGTRILDLAQQGVLIQGQQHEQRQEESRFEGVKMPFVERDQDDVVGDNRDRRGNHQMALAESGPGRDEDQDVQEIERTDCLSRDENRQTNGNDIQADPDVDPRRPFGSAARC